MRNWFAHCNRSNPWRRVFAFEALEPRLPLSGAAGLVPVGTQPIGTLSGKIAYISGGHGWQFLNGAWTTDRPNVNSMIESFGNQDQLDYFADYLLRAGATVVPMRPIGRQVNEVVLDNDSPGVTYTGSWTDSTTFARWYDEDYGAGGNDAIPYRFANVNSSTETATATYTPNLPAAGFYPVYTWAGQSGNRTNQLYKINHTGGQTQIRVDHRLVGNGWVYLGTYHFNGGSSNSEGSVQVSDFSAAGGSVVIADAVRFGNGMGDLSWDSSGIGTGTLSGQPREDEGNILWVYRGLGQGVTASTLLGTSNVNSPLRMASANECQRVQHQRLYWHSLQRLRRHRPRRHRPHSKFYANTQSKFAGNICRPAGQCRHAGAERTVREQLGYANHLHIGWLLRRDNEHLCGWRVRRDDCRGRVS